MKMPFWKMELVQARVEGEISGNWLEKVKRLLDRREFIFVESFNIFD
jgi:hypothetical protein